MKILSVLDPTIFEGLKELSGDSPDFLNDYLTLFCAPIEGRLHQIEKAFTTHDFQTIQLEAHALKSSAANTGALTMSNLCGELEQLAKKNLLEDCQHKFTVLKSETLMVLNEIDSFLKSNRDSK